MKITQRIKFGKEKEEIDELANKILSGEKTATSSLLEYYNAGLKKMSQIGDYAYIVDSADKEKAVVRIWKIEIRKFGSISETFAKEEGDGSLGNWLEIHKKYYSEQLTEIGKELTSDTELVCEWYELVEIR